MSFILDALKKSESDRQRQSGPALFEVRIAPPKARFPLWAVALAALLGVNAIIVGWLLLRHAPRAQTADAATAAHARLAADSSPVAVAAAASANTSAAPAASFHAPTAAAGTGSPASSGPVMPAPATAPAMATKQEPTLWSAGSTGAQADAQADSGANGQPGNPDDYAPATDALPMPGLKGHVRRGTESGYPLYQDAALAPGANLPQLRLDLHVYAQRPQDRFALINMHKLREGDSLPESGLKVEAIVPDGVVLSYNGSKFLLPRD